MKLVLNICLVFSRASIALLMYIRVCAVYNMNRLVVLFFGFTFLGVVAGVAVPFGAVEGTYIGSTKYCTTTVKHDYIFLTPVLSFANDTLIFLAIMYKLGMTDIRRSPTSPISTAWKSTDHLLSFTRVFLQDSQIYYSWVEPCTLLALLSDWSHISIAVAFNLASLITFFVANHPPQSPFRYVVIYPDMAVMNIMACRVFRNVKLGRHSQVLIMPTQLNAGNLTLLDCVPGTGTREHLYHTGDMRTSAEVSRWKESVRLPIPESHGQVIEKPNTHLSGVEVTKVIELTPSWRRVCIPLTCVVTAGIRAFLTDLSRRHR